MGAVPKAPKSAQSSNARVCATNATESPTTATTDTPHAANPAHCPVCRARHAAYRCTAFRAMQPAQRRDFAGSKRLCFNCLAPGPHGPVVPCDGLLLALWSATTIRCSMRSERTEPSTPRPRRRGTPRQCPRRAAPRPHPKQMTPKPSAAVHNACTKPESTSSEPVLLATAIVRAKSAGGRMILIRALLDQGAQTFIGFGVGRAGPPPAPPTAPDLFDGSPGRTIGHNHGPRCSSPWPQLQDDRTALTIQAKVVPRVSSYLPDWTPSTTVEEQFAGLVSSPIRNRPLADRSILIVGGRLFRRPAAPRIASRKDPCPYRPRDALRMDRLGPYRPHVRRECCTSRVGPCSHGRRTAARAATKILGARRAASAHVALAGRRSVRAAFSSQHTRG